MKQSPAPADHPLSYRAEVDGLRALAVVPVILFHAGVDAMAGGYVGVDVFFVISGYLITSIILKELQQGSFSLAHFYQRRARRILPALFAVMAACLPFAWWLMTAEQLEAFSRSLVAVPLFAANVLFWLSSDYFAPSAEEQPLLHIWSLGVEEQYYLVFPLLLIALWRLGVARTAAVLGLLAIGSLALSEWSWRHHAAANFYLPHTRAWELLLGSLLALFSLRTPLHRRVGSELVVNLLATTGLVLIFYAIFAFDSSTPFPGLYALAPALGTALILAFGHGGTWVGKGLSIRWVVAIGLMSYSAYLWHQPLFAFSRIYSVEEPPARLFGWLILLTFLLAWLSWRFVERPFRSGKRVSRRGLMVFAFGGSLTFIALGAAGYLNNGFENRLGSQVREIYSDLRQDKRALCGASAGRDVQPGPGVCNRGDISRPVTIAVVGDSHADTLYARLGDLFAARERNGVLLTYSGCPPILGVWRADQDSRHRCAPHNNAVAEFLIAESAIDTVILAARWTLYMEGNGFDNGEGGVEWNEDGAELVPVDGDSSWQGSEARRQALIAQQIRHSVKGYLDAGKTVILVYPVPEVGWHAPNLMARYLRNNQQPSHGYSTSYEVFTRRAQRANQALDSVGEHPRLLRVRPEAIFCDTWIPGRCVFALDGTPLYFDDDHLSLFGSQFVVDAIAPLLPPRQR